MIEYLQGLHGNKLPVVDENDNSQEALESIISLIKINKATPETNNEKKDFQYPFLSNNPYALLSNGDDDDAAPDYDDEDDN